MTNESRPTRAVDEPREGRFKELSRALQSMVGKPLWGMVTSGAGGSILSLHIGEKVPSDLISRNMMLQLELRTHEGEYKLLVECDWRIERVERVIATYRDDVTPGGLMHRTANSLVGNDISRIELRRPGHDLRIWFSDGALLSVFPSSTPMTERDDYVLFVPREVIVVRATDVRYERDDWEVEHDGVADVSAIKDRRGNRD